MHGFAQSPFSKVAEESGIWEEDLRAQVEAGELLSLRPLGMEHRAPQTYAPVLKRLAPERWQVGLPDHGRSTIIPAQAGEIIAKGQALYVQWQREEKQTQRDYLNDSA